MYCRPKACGNIGQLAVLHPACRTFLTPPRRSPTPPPHVPAVLPRSAWHRACKLACAALLGAHVPAPLRRPLPAQPQQAQQLASLSSSGGTGPAPAPLAAPRPHHMARVYSKAYRSDEPAMTSLARVYAGAPQWGWREAVRPLGTSRKLLLPLLQQGAAASAQIIMARGLTCARMRLCARKLSNRCCAQR